MYKRTSIRFMTIVSLLALGTQAAHAQGANGSGGGGIFALPNFQGDRRSVDLYRYLHPTTPEAWYAYRMLVQQYAQQSYGDPSGWGTGTPGSSGPDAYLSTSATMAGGGAVPGLVNQGGGTMTAVPGMTASGSSMAVPGLTNQVVPMSTGLMSSAVTNSAPLVSQSGGTQAVTSQTIVPPIQQSSITDPALMNGQTSVPVAMQTTPSSLQTPSALPNSTTQSTLSQPTTIGFGTSTNNLTGTSVPSNANLDCGAGIGSQLNRSSEHPDASIWTGY